MQLAVLGNTMDHMVHLREEGYAILRGVYRPSETDILAEEFDRLKASSREYRNNPRPQKDVFFAFIDDPSKGPILRFIHWPARISRTLERFRTDKRNLAILEPLLGNEIKQVTNIAIWKERGVEQTSYEFHQDSRFRRPSESFRNLGSSFIHIAIAIDKHNEESGCMKVYPRSHKEGHLQFGSGTSVYQTPMEYSTLKDLGLDPSRLVNLELQPGDVALWTGHTIHGSGPNHSTHDRRAYINGYMKANDCDLPYWAFRSGRPVPNL